MAQAFETIIHKQARQITGLLINLRVKPLQRGRGACRLRWLTFIGFSTI